ncbi:MAG: glycogen debranching protein GlgX [Anaeromyxobacter sp.]|nr:glycogen debranching protein GlgX [Anaeromyxobacter sp.]
MVRTDTLPGRPFPVGATPEAGGVNFCIWSRDADALELHLFDRAEDAHPSDTVLLRRGVNRTYHYWHVFVPGLRSGQRYGWRAHGPLEPSQGLRFDGQKLLLDPYARAIDVPAGYDRAAARRPGDNAGQAMKAVVADLSAYDWEGDQPLRHPYARTVIYELHVRGFTRHPSSGVPAGRRGTYAGLIEKIPYLRELGVTAVELLPVFQFDQQDAPPGHLNYWGYSPVSFFAPHAGYAAAADPLGVLDEFRDLVKALHRAGLEVILDVVYNHTAEGDELGPTLGLRGLDNRAYYLLDRSWAGYQNHTGCGNTLKAHHPVVRRLILDSLRYWVSEMHVDGFRFDLASVLSRDEDGHPLHNPPIVWEIESDPLLCGTKLIAEAWDAAGLYQVGKWVGDSWGEWNGRFRDDVRAFLRGEPGEVGRLANRIFGSPDLYAGAARRAEQSVNFVACHDGFTLNDLVTYQQKHNLANGEENRDGTDDNRAWNCGVEGPTDDPAVEALRARQVRNLLAITLLSSGVPMLGMGDEARRTQRGNNNAYCQDGELSWLDWDLVDRHADLRRFVRRLLELRHLGVPAQQADGRTLAQLLRRARIEWHGVRLDQPDWSRDSHSLAVTFTGHAQAGRYWCAINAWSEPLRFELPPSRAGWHGLVDTALPSPQDACSWAEALPVEGSSRVLEAHSVVVLGSPG